MRNADIGLGPLDPGSDSSNPVRSALEALEVLQATVFFFALSDTAAAMALQTKGGVDAVSQRLVDAGLSKSVCDQGWLLLGKHESELQAYVRQSVLIAMVSTWDWFMRRAKRFVDAKREVSGLAELKGQPRKQWARLGQRSISAQLQLIEVALGTSLTIHRDVRGKLDEMALVRNLGLHNRWEVDEHYMKMTAREEHGLGQVRRFTPEELHEWHSCLIIAIREVSNCAVERCGN